MSNTKRTKNVKKKNKPSILILIPGQLSLAPSGGKAVHPLPGVKSKPAPLGSDFYSIIETLALWARSEFSRLCLLNDSFVTTKV